MSSSPMPSRSGAKQSRGGTATRERYTRRCTNERGPVSPRTAYQAQRRPLAVAPVGDGLVHWARRDVRRRRHRRARRCIRRDDRRSKRGRNHRRLRRHRRRRRRRRRSRWGGGRSVGRCGRRGRRRCRRGCVARRGLGLRRWNLRGPPWSTATDGGQRDATGSPIRSAAHAA